MEDPHRVCKAAQRTSRRSLVRARHRVHIEALAPSAVESEFSAVLSEGGLTEALRGVEEPE
jgi:hypothetical protein